MPNVIRQLAIVGFLPLTALLGQEQVDLVAVQNTVRGLALAQGLDPDEVATVQLTAEEQQMAIDIDRLAREAAAGNADGDPQLTPAQRQLVEQINTKVRNSGGMPTWLKTLLEGVTKVGDNFSARPINRAITDPIQEALDLSIRNLKDRIETKQSQTADVKSQMDASIGRAVAARPISTDGLPMPDPDRRRSRQAAIQQLESTKAVATPAGASLHGYLTYLNNWEVQTVRYNEELKVLNAKMGGTLDWNERAALQNQLNLLRQDIELHNSKQEAIASETQSAMLDELIRERARQNKIREDRARSRGVSVPRPEY